MQNQSILIVDDEENVLNSLLRLFQAENYEISTASNGKDGLELTVR